MDGSGKRAFEVRPASPQGVEIGYCCTFSTAEQDECLEHCMVKLSMCQVWSCMSNVVSAEHSFSKCAMEIQKEKALKMLSSPSL